MDAVNEAIVEEESLLINELYVLSCKDGDEC